MPYSELTINIGPTSTIGIMPDNNLILNYTAGKSYHSIIADELSDISNKEQRSISFQYVLDGMVREVFSNFV